MTDPETPSKETPKRQTKTLKAPETYKAYKILTIDGLRSSVRPLVTFSVIFVYLAINVYAIYFLLNANKSDNALALLSGISGVATGIVGFWFGTRGKGGSSGK